MMKSKRHHHRMSTDESQLVLMLLYAFRDLWKEWGDSNFQIFLLNCQFSSQAAGVVGPLNCVLYIILNTMVFFWTLEMPYYFYKVFFKMCTFQLFCKYILHVCYVFNAINGLF